MIVTSILATAWNKLIAHIMRERIRNVIVLESGSWQHPWQITPSYYGDKRQWAIKINPGFVNGVDATVKLDAQLAPPDTLERLGGAQDGDVECWLTEAPSWPIDQWRPIGMDAPPTGISDGADGEINITYEQVPEFFVALGVGKPPSTSTGSSGFETSMAGTAEDQASARLLRALDIVLTKTRPATATQVTQGVLGENTIVTYDVKVIIPPAGTERPSLRQTSQYQPEVIAANAALDRLTSGWADPPLDELLLASIYFVSPEGAGFGSIPDASWQPYVKHHVFWNLLHATTETNSLKDEKITLHVGLAGGVGDPLIQFLLAQVNDANSFAYMMLGKNSIGGKFWSI